MYVKCSEDSDRMNRKSPFSTTPLSFDAPSPANPREYLHKTYTRLVVLESRLGLESELQSIFAGLELGLGLGLQGLGLGLGLESYGLGLGLGLEGSASKSFFKSFVYNI